MKRKTLLGVVVFAYRLGRAKLECGLPPRLGGRHAGAQILLGLQRKMFGDLFPQALVGAPPVAKFDRRMKKRRRNFMPGPPL